jgi:hypothetical protein
LAPAPRRTARTLRPPIQRLPHSRCDSERIAPQLLSCTLATNRLLRL